MTNTTQIAGQNIAACDCKDFFDYAMACLFFTLFLAGFLLNSLLLLVIFREKLYHKPSNLFLVNLAIADLGIAIGIICFPFMGYASTEWPFGEVSCRTFEIIKDIVTPVSLLSLAAMSYERYVAVVQAKIKAPKLFRRFNFKVFIRSKLCILISGTWLVSIVTLIPITVNRRLVGIDYDAAVSIKICMMDRYQYLEPKVLVLIRCAITWITPLFIIAYAYSCIAMKLFDLSSSLGRHQNNAALERSRQKAISRARTILILVAVFLFCSFPVHCFLWIYFFDGDAVTENSKFWNIWRQVGFYVFYLYPILNPLFLYTTSSQYRELFNRYLFDHFKCRKTTLTLRTADDEIVKHSKPLTQEEFLSVTNTF